MIDDTSNSRRDLEQQVRKLQEELDEQKRKYEEAVRARGADKEKLDELLVQLSNLEAEINLLKRRIALLEEELGRLRKENGRLHVILGEYHISSINSPRATIFQRPIKGAKIHILIFQRKILKRGLLLERGTLIRRRRQ